MFHIRAHSLRRHSILLLPLLVGLTLSTALLLGAARARASQSAASQLPVEELALNPSGGVREVNGDADGGLWISDFDADEIWHVQPASGAYTVYQGLSAPTDARPDGSGSVWWTAGLSHTLGQLDPTGGSVNLWPITETTYLYSTQVDQAGRIWVLDFFDPRVYRLDAAANTLCAYDLPEGAVADYMVPQGNQMWLGDWVNDQVLRLDPAGQQFSRWPLPDDGYLEDIALDEAGRVWWAEAALGQIRRLDPAQDQLVSYPLPAGEAPEMIALTGQQLWYTEDVLNSFGRLDPAAASGTTTTLTSTVDSLIAGCRSITPLAATATISNGQAAWQPATYDTVLSGGGWQVHELPEQGTPWGIAALDEGVYVADYGRQVLIRPQVGVTACKVEDGDGDPATTADQTPVEQWPLYLTVAGQRQEPGQLSGPDGCANWSGLSPGTTYGVEEDVISGWVALEDTSHSFGPVEPGLSYGHTFANSRLGTISACKFEDRDGSLVTAADRRAVEDWPLQLTIEGVPLEPGQLSGQNGCATWTDLTPGLSYGVEEQVLTGWVALNDTSHSFGLLGSGDVRGHNFVNSRPATVTACKLEDDDGDPATVDDRTALADWPLYLTVDGQRQQPARLSGADGCATWTELTLGLTYGVAEDVPDGWVALSGTTRSFGPATSGGDYTHTFVNAAEPEFPIYLPSLMKP
ncbi:MAG: hypothetical protein R3300_17690 [Candidatus Promineifilaceae bacterium]|nr:hypothetical protein [Candidatus Promineifilaceae bacterium]